MTLKNEVSLSWFATTLSRFYLFFAELIFLAICVRLLRLIEPFVFQVIIDRVLPFERQATLAVIIVVFLLVTVFQIGFSLLANLVGLRTANQVTLLLGRKIIKSFLTRQYAHFRNWDVGENIARINETDTIRRFLVGASTSGLLDVLFSLIYVAVLYALSPQMTVIILVSIPVQAAVYIVFGPILRWSLQDRFDANADYQSKLVETISGIDVIKAMAAEEETFGRLSQSLDKRLAAEYKVGWLQALNLNMVFSVNQMITISIIYFGSNLVFEQQITLGQLIAFHLISARISEFISKFSAIWESWQNIRISRRRLADLVLTEAEPFGMLPRLPEQSKADLVMDGVDFSYTPGRPVLSDLSFLARAGDLLLIVGPSGMGKSTFGRLAAGLERPTGGRVMFGGLDIADYDPHSVRERLVYVPQSPFLFSGTLRQNLCLGQKNLSEQDMWHVLEQTGAADFVKLLPGALDAEMGERGQNLSGGQRQRVAIARALLRRPSVLVLDEPTSSLDAAAEKHLIEHINALRGKVTLIVITHRPGAFGAADQTIDFGEFNRDLA